MQDHYQLIHMKQWVEDYRQTLIFIEKKMIHDHLKLTTVRI